MNKTENLYLMPSLFNIHVEHPKTVEEILTPIKRIAIDHRQFFGPVMAELESVLLPSSAFIEKKGQKQDVSKHRIYFFVLDTSQIWNEDSLEAWYFDDSNPVAAFTTLLKELRNGKTLIAKNKTECIAVFKPEDAEELVLDLNLEETWKRLCGAYFMYQIGLELKWAPETPHASLIDVELVENWSAVAGHADPTTWPEATVFEYAVQRLDKILTSWREEFCTLASAHRYNYFALVSSPSVVRIEMYDDVRGIQASMNELHRLAMLENE